MLLKVITTRCENIVLPALSVYGHCTNQTVQWSRLNVHGHCTNHLGEMTRRNNS